MGHPPHFGWCGFPPSSLFGGAALVGVAFPLLFGVVLQSLRPFWVVFFSLPPASFHFLGVLLPLSILNQTRVKSSEVNESNVVLLSGGDVFPLLPFWAVLLFFFVFHSCVVHCCSSSFWVLFASSLSLPSGVVPTSVPFLGVNAFFPLPCGGAAGSPLNLN